MKSFSSSKAATLLMSVLLLPMTACGLSGGSVEGRVLEDGTNEPIADAIVVVRWTGSVSSLADSHEVCVHVDTATTDREGRYRVAAWSKRSEVGPVSDLGPVVSAYKAGYVEPRFGTANLVHLASFSGGTEERMEYLLRLTGSVGCYGSGDEKALVAVYKALYDEAKRVFAAQDEQYALQGIRRRAVYAWLRPSRGLSSVEIDKAIQRDSYLREQFQ